MADLSKLTDEELEALAAELEPVNTGGVLGDTALRGAVDNLLNIGPATGEIAAQGAAALRSAGPGFSEEFGPKLVEERSKFPANVLSQLKPPESMGTSFDLQAGVKSLFGPGTFEENRDTIVEEFLQRRQAAPHQSLVGDIGGDIGALGGIRTGFQRGLRNRAAAAAGPDMAFGAARNLTPQSSLTPGFLEGARNISKAAFDKIVPTLKRGGIRVGETGLEGALIAAMNDNDPLTTAAIAAGAQTVGGTALAATRGLFGNKGANLAMAAAGTMSFLQLFKEATPGGRDRILESSETAFAKLAALITVAGLAGAGGLGRVKGNLRTQQPELADLITTLPRGNLLSLFSSMSEDDSGEVELVLTHMMNNPESDYFGPTAKRRFERSLTVAGAPSLREQIDLLKSDKRFKRRLIELPKREAELHRAFENTPTHQIDRSRVRN